MQTEFLNVFKAAIATAIIGSSCGMMAVADSLGSVPMQLTALGILGAAVLYVLTKIVPAAMKQRDDERQAFVNAMQHMADVHTVQMRENRQSFDKAFRELHDEYKAERAEWLSALKANQAALQEVSAAMRVCQANGR